MKTVQCIDFSGTPSSYNYVSGEIAGRPAVVFVQGSQATTSITNLIEILSTKVFSVDFPGVDPRDIRIFEFYPPKLQPIREWQEVSFDSISECNEHSGVLAKLLQLVGIAKPLPIWLVEKPQWRVVSDAETTQLKTLLNTENAA